MWMSRSQGLFSVGSYALRSLRAGYAPALRSLLVGATGAKRIPASPRLRRPLLWWGGWGWCDFALPGESEASRGSGRLERSCPRVPCPAGRSHATPDLRGRATLRLWCYARATPLQSVASQRPAAEQIPARCLGA